MCYLEGLGTKKNIELSNLYYTRAAAAGHPRSLNHIGICYKRGSNGYPKDLIKALSYFQQGALLNDAKSQYNYAMMLEHGPQINLAEALKYYKLSAENKNPTAAYHVGRFYNEGIGVEKNEAIAFKYFSTAVAGCDKAYFYLGEAYYYGRVTTQDYTMAEYYFELAETPDSYFYLGKMYLHGLGVKKCVETSFVLLTGFVLTVSLTIERRMEAFCLLGKMHLLGHGTPRNTLTAKLEFEHAEACGYVMPKHYQQLFSQSV